MRSPRLWLALSLALLLLSRQGVKLASATATGDDDDDEGFQDFGEGDDGMDGEDYGGDDMEGGGGDMQGLGTSEIPEGDDGDVINLSKDALEARVASGEGFVVYFYAPWCGHCKELAPEYKAAAAELKESGAVLAKIDATKFEEVAMDYGVEGYPTLFWVQGSSKRQFNGERNRAEIVAWVRKRMGQAVVTLTDVEDAQRLAHDKSPLVAAYFKDLQGVEAQAFSESLKESDDADYAQTDKADVAQALGLSTASAAAIAVLKKEDDKFVAYEGKYTSEAITRFVMDNRLPLLITFSNEATNLIFSGPVKKMVFLFFKSNDYDATKTELTPVFREFKGKAVFVYVNGSDADMKNVREFFGVRQDDRLALGFSTEEADDGTKYRMAGDLTAPALKAFTADFVAGKAKPHYKSEKRPEGDSGPVAVVVGDTFEEIVMDSTKDVLLEVYAPWCGHCKSLEPTYNKLGEAFAGVGSVVVAKMDGTANEHPSIKVEGFPTILFYPANRKNEPVTVDADRTVEGLSKFIKEHASMAFEMPGQESEASIEEIAEEEELKRKAEL